ncbi:MAG: hypothetical protein R8G66_05265 [Cytophagales bacterium]|nr:hypothetical protein [Cytophagales bacterium]
MKQLLLSLFLSAGFLYSYAQDALTLDNRILGGGLSFSQNDASDVYPFSNDVIPGENRNNKHTAFSFTPYFGRFYQDHKMIGLRLHLNRSESQSENLFDDREHTHQVSRNAISLGGFLRQYIPFTDKFGVFLEEGIDVGRSTFEASNRSLDLEDPAFPRVFRNDREETKAWNGSIDAEFGIYVFVLDRLSIETRLARFYLAYSDTKLTRSDLFNDETRTGEGSNTSVNFNLVNNFSFDQLFTLNYYF